MRSHRALIMLAVFVFSALLHWSVYLSGGMKLIHLAVYDSILRLNNAIINRVEKPAVDDICIVDIDEYSISKLGQFSSWQSCYFADLIDAINADSPILIAFDVFFTEPDSLSEYGRNRLQSKLAEQGIPAETIFPLLSTDHEFARAIEEAGNVYLGMYNSREPKAGVINSDKLTVWDVNPKAYMNVPNPVYPIPMLSEAVYGLGFAHIEPDKSGIIHGYPLFFKHKNQFHVNFSFQACLDLLSIDKMEYGNHLLLKSQGQIIRKIPLDSEGKALFNFYGKSGRFRYISFADVLYHRLPPGYFQNRIVLVGSSASGLRDIKSIPLETDYPGVELHATFMQNLLAEDFIHWLHNAFTWLISVILLILLSQLMRYSRPFFTVIFYFAFSLGLYFLAFGLYHLKHIVFDYSIISVPWLVGYLGLLIHETNAQKQEKKKVLGAFEHYVSKAVISEIMKTDNPLKVGGKKTPASIMFIDIRSFSSLCELLSPTEITNFLNMYFNRITKIITDHHGMLDKYIGDAILALYNIPVPLPNYTLYAVETALKVKEEASLIQHEFEDHEVLKSFKIGVGIATGEVIAGNLGSDEIFNFTGIGDKMNLSSRLESLNKFYHTSIIIDEATYLEVKDKFLCRWLDFVTVKGKNIAVKIYELIGRKTEPISPYVEYEKALAYLTLCEVELAYTHFTKALQVNPEDYPTSLMLKRIETLNRGEFNGVYHHESK